MTVRRQLSERNSWFVVHDVLSPTLIEVVLNDTFYNLNYYECMMDGIIETGFDVPSARLGQCSFVYESGRAVSFLVDEIVRRCRWGNG